MIIKVKQNNNKKKLTKIVAFVALISFVVAYYFHMGDKFKEQEEEIVKQSVQTLQEERALAIESIILDEAEIAVDLLSQDKVRTVRVIGRKLYIAVDPDTSLDALMVRYGVAALIKESAKDTKIAIDLRQIVESKYREQDL